MDWLATAANQYNKCAWKKAIRVSTLDHKSIMEKATKCDRLEYKEDNVQESDEDSEESKESESESK